MLFNTQLFFLSEEEWGEEGGRDGVFSNPEAKLLFEAFTDVSAHVPVRP
jgi:hypothetical protein